MKMRESGLLNRIGAWVEAAGAWWGAAVAGWAVVIYMITYFVLPGAVSPALYMYVIQPLLWLSLAFLAFLGWRQVENRPALSKSLVFTAILTGAFQMALFFIAGLFLLSFGRSPYGHRFLTLLGNLAYVGSMLLAFEMSRAYLGAVLSRRSPMLALALLSLLFSLVSIPVGKFRLLGNALDTFELVGKTFLPTISENLLATFLALIGGPGASIAYRGTLLAIEWLSPTLPRLPWLVTAFIGTLVPVLALLVIYNRFWAEPAAESEAKPQEGQSTTTWLLVAVAAVGLLWFNTGVFGIRPVLVSGPSMSPAMVPGDMVIIRDVPPEAVEVGDVIRFRQGGIDVIHRVMDIQGERSEITFITRGDYNDADDPPVPASDLEGKVILTVPKIGWVAIGARKLIDWIS